jgi:putative ABC transport system substrate-binding protein
MRRRHFITLLGSAVAWPLAARAQQPAMPVIGFLHSSTRESPDSVPNRTAAFHRGLKEAGYAEGENVAIEYRWAEGHYDRLPELAAELVRRNVAVILAGANSAALAAKAATATIPIVFSTGSDPVQLGLVPSLGRPGGNITGVSGDTNFLDPKRLELLHEVVPSTAVIAVLINPNFRDAEKELNELQSAAMSFGQKLLILKASTASEIQASFMTLVKEHAGALIVTNDGFFNSRPDVLVPLSVRHAVPTIFQSRVRSSRRLNELRKQHYGKLSSGWALRRPYSQGRKAKRPPDNAADQIRADH